MGVTDEAIEIAATQFRVALERVDPQIWKARLIDFPHGSCGHCAELLGRHLRERLGIEATVVSADFALGDRWSSHAWLEVNGLIIDISADQFNKPPVIVTRNSAFHAAGSEIVKRPLNRDGGWWNTHCSVIWSAALLACDAS